jgi:hypothetical protein
MEATIRGARPPCGLGGARGGDPFGEGHVWALAWGVVKPHGDDRRHDIRNSGKLKPLAHGY